MKTTSKTTVVSKHLASSYVVKKRNHESVKVLVAMSGGVDSSVAALLMKQKGYDVTGVFLKCWSETKDFKGECNWREEWRSAVRIAAKLKIPIMKIDAEEAYKKYVIDEMFKDYKKGITPNPDILCNEVVKFPFLFEQAKRLQADYLVTGHYVRIKKTNKGMVLQRGKSEHKDQSYFLYRLKEQELNKLLFPIGDYTKEEVRHIAEQEGFLNYNKKSTVGICFVGKIPMMEFLKTRIKIPRGTIKDPQGNIIGTHEGAYYYTIGQRLGTRNGAEFSKNEEDKQNISRWYVAQKNIKKNEIIAAPEQHVLLQRDTMIIKDLHLITKNKQEFLSNIKKKPLRVTSRIRHVGELQPTTIHYDKKRKLLIATLRKKLTGISDGQAIVLYQGTEVLGGGTISS